MPEYKQFTIVLCAKELDSLHKVLQCIKESRYFRVCVMGGEVLGSSGLSLCGWMDLK